MVPPPSIPIGSILLPKKAEEEEDRTSIKFPGNIGMGPGFPIAERKIGEWGEGKAQLLNEKIGGGGGEEKELLLRRLSSREEKVEGGKE